MHNTNRIFLCVYLGIHLPVMHAVKRLLIRNIIHEDEAHGTPVVRCGDGPVAFLSGRVLKTTPVSISAPAPRVQPPYPYLQLDALVVPEYSFYFEINADCADERWGEAVVRISKQKRRLSDRTVSYDQQFEHVVEILVGGVLLPFWIGSSHLQR